MGPGKNSAGANTGMALPGKAQSKSVQKQTSGAGFFAKRVDKEKERLQEAELSGGQDRFSNAFSKGDDVTGSGNMDSSSHVSGSLNRQSLVGGGDNVFDPLGLASQPPAGLTKEDDKLSGGLFSSKKKEEKQIISPPSAQAAPQSKGVTFSHKLGGKKNQKTPERIKPKEQDQVFQSTKVEEEHAAGGLFNDPPAQ